MTTTQRELLRRAFFGALRGLAERGAASSSFEVRASDVGAGLARLLVQQRQPSATDRAWVAEACEAIAAELRA